MWKQLVFNTLKPYEELTRKDLGSYEIAVEPRPLEYRIRQTSNSTPTQSSSADVKITNQNILEYIMEEAKFMRSQSQPQSPVDALESGGQKPHIIESDTFFKLPIQEVME